VCLEPRFLLSYNRLSVDISMYWDMIFTVEIFSEEDYKIGVVMVIIYRNIFLNTYLRTLWGERGLVQEEGKITTLILLIKRNFVIILHLALRSCQTQSP
jgi:hypothetical protein